MKQLDQLDLSRDIALRDACNGAASSSACTTERVKAKVAEFDLLRHANTPEAAEQLRQALKDPDLMRYTIASEIRSIKVLDDEVVAQLSTSIAKSLFSLGADFTPGVGDAKAFAEAKDPLDYAFASIGLVPVAGDVASALLKEAKALLKQGKVAEADAVLKRLASDVGAKTSGGAVELTFDKATRTWTTPAGLDYGQGSVQGNRVLHVLEHAEPNPAKTTHSVFSMDRNEILGAIDEAWLKKGSPVVGDPGAYVVPMGRAIGTSGETSIKIIVRPGTNQVITAYPVK